MYFRELIEATLSQVARKQKSVTRLFPDFFTNPVKVPGIISKGGLRMTGMEKDVWKFNVHSGSEEGKWYEVVLRWKNLVPAIQRGAQDRRNWTKPKGGERRVNLKKLAAYIFKKGDVEFDCECPADAFFGGDYIRSQPKYQAKYGDQENRPPDKRNPKQYGAHCKHIQALYKALPWYKTTMAQWLKKEYGSVIQKAEQKASAELTGFQQAAKALGKRKTEAVAARVDPQAAMKKKHRNIINTKLKPSTWENEEQYRKFWILQDGSLIPVVHSHKRTSDEAGVDILELERSGAIDGTISSGELNIDGAESITDAQVSRLRQMFVEYKMTYLVDEVGKFNFEVPIASAKELVYYLEFGKEAWEHKILENDNTVRIKPKLDFAPDEEHLYLAGKYYTVDKNQAQEWHKAGKIWIQKVWFEGEIKHTQYV